MLEKNLKSYGFKIYHLNMFADPTSSVRKESQRELKKVKMSRKDERIEILDQYNSDDYDVIGRKRELIAFEKRTEEENRELKIATKWLSLYRQGKERSEITKILKDGTDDRSIKRNLKQARIASAKLKDELIELIQIGKRYDADDRSNLLIQAENNMNLGDTESLNIIKKNSQGQVNGRTSKRIFSEFFTIKTHVYSGKHSISVEL